MLLFSPHFVGSESLPFGQNQRAYMLSEQRAAPSACESASTTLLPCQRAAQPILLQYASPPVDLQKNAFHRATDKQNSRWVSLDLCSQGLASPTAAPLQSWHRCESADGGLHSWWCVITMRRWHKGEGSMPKGDLSLFLSRMKPPLWKWMHSSRLHTHTN